ncbi:uncharacterized protein LOC133929158 isoform X2 [Phragmites australis]|nr:uncharacterized protein LOC133929158 isoform X2 [Phragmites australis]
MFLTSASLFKALNDKRKDHDNLEVHVRHEDNVVTGFLGEYDLDHNIAAVSVVNFPDLHDVALYKGYKGVKFPPHSKVVAVGHDISGKLMATSGVLNGDSSGSDEKLTLSTCKISKDCDGGPLFDFDGNFVGMNLFLGTERTFFLHTFRILLWLRRCTSLREIQLPAQLNCFKAVRVGERLTGEIPNSDEVHRDVLNKDQFGDLESLGYPKPPESMSNDGMILVNTFEEPFGDVCGKGVWSELSETASSNIQENIVALASFNGEKRFSACTGFFIEWNGCTTILTSANLIINPGYENKIVENLRIEVLCPNKQRAEGTLQHYNLHYNVALVSIKDFCARQPVIIQHRWCGSCELLAVGCCFKSGRLMAARGRQFPGPNTLDCKYLGYSTCRITKAGIGGPLLDFDGKFVGMNFYDDEEVGTPYLSWREILAILDYFKTKGTVSEVGHDGKPSRVLDWTLVGDRSVCPNRWPVPIPYWCHPDDLVKHKSEIRSRRCHAIYT